MPPMRGQVLHEVVERLQRALARRRCRNGLEPPFGLAGEDGDAADRARARDRWPCRRASKGSRRREIRRSPPECRPRGTAARYRARADTGSTARPTSAEQAEIAVPAEAADQLRDVDAGVGLVDQVDIDLDVRAEHLPLGAIEREAVDRGERVRWDQRPPPANDIAVIVVMGRLDQNQLKAALHNFSAPIFAARYHAKGIPADRLGAP